MSDKPPTEILKKMKLEENNKKIVAQGKYCSEHNLPFFAPISCFHCGKDTFDKYSTEECKSMHILSCRWCNASFVE